MAERTLSTRPRSSDRACAETPSEASLHVIYPRGLEGSQTISSGAMIGRQPGDGVVIDHATVSREHLELVWDKVWLAHVGIDRGSYNGTRVGGGAVEADQRVALEHGTVVQVGDVLAIYERPLATGSDDPSEVSRAAIPGVAAATRQLRTAVARAAADPAPVLLVGETGTGKEHIARELHRLSGRAGAWVPVNCAALSPELIESQLFGHVRGAFTGASVEQPGFFRTASGGTLFLDEIGELPVDLQAKLLRAIQEREVHPVGSSKTVPVDVRIIAATNLDLVAAVEAGEFRRDLFARLALWEIAAPALRERRPDILSWLDILHRAWRVERGLDADELIELSPDAAEVIALHAWPDNLRGLSRLLHAIEAAGLGGEPIAAEQLPEWLRDRSEAEVAAAKVRRKSPSRDELAAVFEELERNVSATARHFGRDRKQIYRWLDAYGLRRD